MFFGANFEIASFYRNCVTKRKKQHLKINGKNTILNLRFLFIVDGNCGENIRVRGGGINDKKRYSGYRETFEKKPKTVLLFINFILHPAIWVLMWILFKREY